MLLDPTDGCPDCGTIDRNHDSDCEHAPPSASRALRRWASDCAGRHDNHRHCPHGHVQDCPDPSECDLLPAGS